MGDLEPKKYIDLFAGCGGLSLGLHNAGWKGVFAIEKSVDAFNTLEYNLINSLNHFDWPNWLPKESHDINDVLKKYKKELIDLRGHIDMIAGGPPCQGFSMAGRRNEHDIRNNLVKSYIRFISLVKPKIIFFENVKGFTLEFKKNKDKGIAYSSYVKSRLNQLDYQVYGELVNFADYGVPQRRTRFILVGIRKDIAGENKSLAKSFFLQLMNNRLNFLTSKGLSIDTNLGDAISDLLKSNGTIQSPDTKSSRAGVYGKPQSKYQKIMRGNSTLDIPDSHRFANHRLDIEKRFQSILSDSKTRRNKDLDKHLRIQYNIKKHTIIPLDKDDKSPTITTLPDDYIHYLEPRILTVREYARIQSFPDSFVFKGKYTTGGKRRVLEVPRYTQIGNAIPPLFAEQAGVILSKII
ncbi:DNA cytosine methyltransferase [Dysgonomonas massiliensis]|uniref:DNA cytosine methyltransferase n=1 Tax=Dysgonomonas massiliensis TaxID=2040292 RepID=UPI000C772422|nr:DNA cytosine methyltransferase [Dysgonomonas massiliensis]